MLGRSAQLYEEMKAAKDTAEQVIVRYLTFGNTDGDNDPTPLNAETFRFDNSPCRYRCHIVLPNNSPRRRCRALPYENLEPETVYCWTTEDISRSMALQFFIRPRPSRIGLRVTKIQEEKREMEDWMR